jgi:hypothetical protein
MDAWVTLDLHGGAHKRRPELDAWVVRIAEGRWPPAPRTRSVGRRVATRQEEGWRRVGRSGGARTVRGGGWQHVGIGGVAGGRAPGDRDRRGGARMARGGGARGSEGWRCARLVWGLAGGRTQEEEH